jgi:PAS domain S-box-containing protein
VGETLPPAHSAWRVARWLLVLLAAVWAVVAFSTVPGVRPRPGFVPLWDGWFQCAGYALAAVLAGQRAVAREHQRLLWSLVAAALGLRAFAFVWTIAVLDRPPPYPSLADVCWLLSGLLLVAALWLLARAHLPRTSRTLVLDAVLGGLTVAAVAVASLYGTLVSLSLPGTPTDVVATNLAYPLIDVAQLILIVGLLTATQWRVAPAVLAMSLGIVAMAVVDCVFLYLASTGQYRPGSVLTPLSLGGTALVALAAWLAERAPRRAARDGTAGLVVPVLLALVCVGVLIYDATRTVPIAGTIFAAAGIVVAIVRGYVTLTGDREAATATIDAQQRDLERFQALVGASTDFIGIADTSGRLVYLNPAGRSMVGLSPDVDVTHTVVGDYLTDEAMEVWRRVRQPEVLRRGHWEGESSLRDQRGDAIPVVASTFAIRDPDSDEVQLIATVQRDISERKAAEQDLRRFGSLVEASADFIAIAGVDGRVQYVNPGGRDLVGLPPDTDVTETTIADYLTEDGVRASLEIEQPAVVAEGHWEGESTLRDLRGGPPIPVAINSFLVSHPDSGEPWLLATVQRDISDRIASQREVQALADERQLLLGHLVQAQEDERARIAADVHDDSVQSLAAVELRLSLLQKEIAERQPDLLPTLESLRGTVRGATDRLRHLLFDLESPAQQHDLSSALSEAAAYVLEDAVRWRVEGDGGRDLEVATRVTAYRIAKEAMVNVRKHAAAHRVVIGLHDRDGGVEVSVVDDGRGFDPADAADRPGHLGLPGMRDRATVAGGSVVVESAEGAGTTVRLWLPDHAGDGDHRPAAQEGPGAST